MADFAEASLVFDASNPGLKFDALAGETYAVELDGDDASPQPSPTQLLLASLGGCTGMDVASILRTMRQPVTAYRIALRGEYREEHPRIFTSIAVRHSLEGEGVSPERVRRAIELSATKYCRVAAMLQATVPITHSYHVLDTRDGGSVAGTYPG